MPSPTSHLDSAAAAAAPARRRMIGAKQCPHCHRIERTAVCTRCGKFKFPATVPAFAAREAV